MDSISHDPSPSVNKGFEDRESDDRDDAASNRSKVRDSLFLMAGFRLTGAGETRQVRVRNLSAGGLMAELPDPLDIGTGVEIDVRGIGIVPGRVAWSTEGRVGIAFDRQIDPLAARKPVGGTTAAKRASLKPPLR
jgi:hypothetical protein